MQPSVRQTLNLIRQEIAAGLVQVPTAEEIKHQRNEVLDISQDSLAELAEVSPGAIEAIDLRGQSSAAMRVWLKRVMDMAVWDDGSERWVRMTLDANGKSERLAVEKRIRIGKGFFRHGLGRRARRRAEAREARRQAEATQDERAPVAA